MNCVHACNDVVKVVKQIGIAFFNQEFSIAMFFCHRCFEACFSCFFGCTFERHHGSEGASYLHKRSYLPSKKTPLATELHHIFPIVSRKKHAYAVHPRAAIPNIGTTGKKHLHMVVVFTIGFTIFFPKTYPTWYRCRPQLGIPSAKLVYQLLIYLPNRY